jgi:hypothetical protein
MLPLDFIETARRLLGTEGTEADLRSSVSRAYYGALHACLDALPREFTPARRTHHKAGSHSAIIEATHAWGRSTRGGRTNAKQIARSLDQLRRRRVVADYRLAQPFSVDAAASVSDAGTVVNMAAHARHQYDEMSVPPTNCCVQVEACRDKGR